MTTGSQARSEKASLVDPVRSRHIMHAYLPKGWKVKMGGSYQPGASGLCAYSVRGGTIYCPFVCDDYSLYVYLHEVGHAKLHKTTKKPSHVVEYEAEQFAMKAMRDCGFSVRRAMLDGAKAYIREEIIKDRAKGHPIDPKIDKWSRR